MEKSQKQSLKIAVINAVLMEGLWTFVLLIGSLHSTTAGSNLPFFSWRTVKCKHEHSALKRKTNKQVNCKRTFSIPRFSVSAAAAFLILYDEVLTKLFLEFWVFLSLCWVFSYSQHGSWSTYCAEFRGSG